MTIRASRVKDCHVVQDRLRSVRVMVEKTATCRAWSASEQHWLGSVADALDCLIAAGDAVLPQRMPRPDRKARKRPRIDAYPVETQWEREVFGP